MEWKEKRKHPRFKAAEKALAAEKDDPYTLMDLSSGGLGIRYYGEQPLPAEIKIDLFFLDREFTLTGVRCRKVFEERHDQEDPEKIPEWHVGLQIVDPTPELMEKLRQFRWTENEEDQ
jgi:hypothetical protein